MKVVAIFVSIVLLYMMSNVLSAKKSEVESCNDDITSLQELKRVLNEIVKLFEGAHKITSAINSLTLKNTLMNWLMGIGERVVKSVLNEFIDIVDKNIDEMKHNLPNCESISEAKVIPESEEVGSLKEKDDNNVATVLPDILNSAIKKPTSISNMGPPRVASSRGQCNTVCVAPQAASQGHAQEHPQPMSYQPTKPVDQRACTPKCVADCENLCPQKTLQCSQECQTSCTALCGAAPTQVQQLSQQFNCNSPCNVQCTQTCTNQDPSCATGCATECEQACPVVSCESACETGCVEQCALFDQISRTCASTCAESCRAVCAKK